MQHTYTVLSDDLDGSEASETIRYAYDGKAYSIDLNEANAAAFRSLIGRYIEVSRVETPSTARQPARIARQRRSAFGHIPYDARKVRDWAIRRGYGVSERGRLSYEILEAYLAEQDSV